MALRAVSRGKVSRWAVEMAEGRRVPAIELQRRYLRLASDNYRGRDGPTDWVLAQWEEVLDGLETDPMSLADRLDWVAKLKVLETYREELGADWGDDALHSVDMEYHNIDPNQGLYHALVRMNRMRRLVSETDILDAVTDPPNDTRAHGRSQVIRALLSRRSRRYWVDWDMVAVEGGKQIVFRDPFWDYGRQAREFTAALRGAS
jgi:proteasome accessory factor A